MHDDEGNIATTGPGGSVEIAPDGSMAAFVPARRAITWQLVDPEAVPVVRERYWISFQPGEIRACGGCHGANTFTQNGGAPPSNPPEALRTLMRYYKNASVAVEPDADPSLQDKPLNIFPNPFHRAASLRYSVASAGHVSLSIFSVGGREIARLVDQFQPAGEYAVDWNAAAYGSGLYISRLNVNGQVSTGKMILAK